MHATVTDKGQITVPKGIRDQLGIEAGTKLDFRVEKDGSLRLRKVERGSASLFGLLHDPGRKSGSIADMNESVGRLLAEDDERIQIGAALRPRRR